MQDEGIEIRNYRLFRHVVNSLAPTLWSQGANWSQD